MSAAESLVFDGTNPGEDPPIIATQSPGISAGKKIPPGDCLGQARTKLYGKAVFSSQFTTAQQLSVNAAESAQADPRVAAYILDWATCMKARGFNYPDPYSVSDIDLNTPAPTPREIQIAIADIECKQQTNLAPRWMTVLVEYEQAAVEKNQLVLNSELKQRKKVVGLAVAVVENSQ